VIDYITKAIITRLKADTGAGGLYESGSWHYVKGVYAYRAADDADRPFIKVNVSQRNSDTLTSDGCEFTVSLSIVSNNSEGGALLQTIWNRVFGDAMLQTGRVPTYGLHRHILSLGSTPLSASCTYLMHDETSEVFDEDTVTYSWDVRFSSRWDAQATSP